MQRNVQTESLWSDTLSYLIFLIKVRVMFVIFAYSCHKNSTKMLKCKTCVWVWSGFNDKNYLYPGLMLNAWSLYLQILHVLRFHHSPGGLVGNSGCSSVHLSASVSLSLLPATSRVYFSFLFSSPRLSFSLEHSHLLSSLSHSFILIISYEEHISTIYHFHHLEHSN